MCVLNLGMRNLGYLVNSDCSKQQTLEIAKQCFGLSCCCSHCLLLCRYQDKLKELHAAQVELASRLREQRDSACEKKASIHETDGELKEKQEMKSKVLFSLIFVWVAYQIKPFFSWQEMSECLSTQAKLKHLQAAKENRYRLLHRTHESRVAEMERQREKLHALYSVVQKIESDMPELSTAALKSLTTGLKSRIASSEIHPAKELVVA